MRFVVALLPMVVLLACSSPSNPAKAEPTVNHQQIIDRYTHDIWPAMSAYNADHAQAGSAAQQFAAVTEPSLPADQFNALRKAAQGLGRQGEYDAQDQTSHYNDGLTLGHVDVQSAQADDATLVVCYTYEHYSYVDVSDTRHVAAASEVSVKLKNVVDTWYLAGIDDDRPVPNCDASNS